MKKVVSFLLVMVVSSKRMAGRPILNALVRS